MTWAFWPEAVVLERKVKEILLLCRSHSNGILINGKHSFSY